MRAGRGGADVGHGRQFSDGARATSAGVYGWATASEPYQLFIAATLSGFGWVTMGTTAVNAVVSPWFVSKRPAALAQAYNGASIGGVIFSSAWVYLIDVFGFATAAAGMAVLSVLLISALSFTVFRVRPEQLGQYPDGTLHASAETPLQLPEVSMPLKDNRQFITLAAAMALGLFAQIGLVSQLFLMLAHHMTEQTAGIAMGLATASAIAGRYGATWLLARGIKRRTVACLSYGCQVAGCLSLIGLGEYPALLWAGMILFGIGIGNATSLPPLIAQTEFPRQQVARVVTLIVATAQGCYAFAPVAFGAMKELLGGASGEMFILLATGGIQALALVALNVGSKPGRHCQNI